MYRKLKTRKHTLFLDKDQIQNKEVRVEYMFTHLTLADYFTKPLQGEQFKIMRSYIMGWVPICELIKKQNTSENSRIKDGVESVNKIS